MDTKETIFILKKDKTKQSFDETKIHASIKRNSEDLQIDKQKVYEEFLKNIYNEISTIDIEKCLLMAAYSLAEDHLDYDKLATRIFLQKIYKEVFGKSLLRGEEKEEAQKRYFVYTIRSFPKYDEKLKEFDIDSLAEHLILNNDDKWNFIGITNLYEKLLATDSNDFIKETPQMFLMRVAMGVHINEKSEDRSSKTIHLYQIYSSHLALGSTPILFYSGMKRAQLSSCGGGVIDDTTESIFAGVSDSFTLGKWSYGIGSSISKLRSVGSHVSSTGINSSGIVPFLKIFDAVCQSVNRGGRKRGAMQFTLENWHYETEEFLKLRKNTGDDRLRTHDLNTCLWISDEFMKRVLNDDAWMLIDPAEAKNHGYDLTELYGQEFSFAYQELERKAHSGQLSIFKFVKAKDLWKEMLKSLFETGHPWITYKDSSNVRNLNSHAGKIYSTNLCLTGDTLVEIEIDGEQSIEEMKNIVNLPKETVIKIKSYDINKNVTEFKTISNRALMSSKSKILRITDTQTGKYIKCTRNHLIYTKNRGYIEAQYLNKDDFFVID